MSYILDALRRADAERRRGATPALQQVAQAGDWPARAAVGGPRRWLSLAVVAMALLTGGLAIWWLGRPAAAPTPTAAPAVATAPVAPAVVVPPPVGAVPITSPAPLPITAPAPVPITAPAPVPMPITPPTPVPAPAPAPVPAAAVAPMPAPPAAPPTPPAPAPALARPPVAAPVAALAPSSPPAPAVAAAAAPAAPPRPIPISALSEPQRSQLAGLAFGGAVHSLDRTQSFVLQGGQLVREGQTVAPGVVLERIEPRALVLRVGEQLVLLPL